MTTKTSKKLLLLIGGIAVPVLASLIVLVAMARAGEEEGRRAARSGPPAPGESRSPGVRGQPKAAPAARPGSELASPVNVDPRSEEAPALPGSMTVAEREGALLARVRASGAALESWMDHARQVFPGSDFECHHDGCITSVTYADELAFELAEEQLTTSEVFQAFPGWRHRSLRKEESGRVIATWFFMKPADDK